MNAPYKKDNIRAVVVCYEVEINKTPDVIFELIVMRVIGRVLILAIAILIFFQYAHISA